MNQFSAVYGQLFCCSCPSGFVGSRCDNRTGVLVAYPLLAHNSYAWVAGVVGFLVVFTVLVVGIVYCCRRRRRGEDNELISIIKFRSALRGRHLASSPDSSMRSLGGGDTSYENPNFIDQEDENANNPQSKVTLVMSPSDDSLDSAFVSTRREDSLDFMEGSSDVRLLDSNQYDSP